MTNILDLILCTTLYYEPVDSKSSRLKHLPQYANYCEHVDEYACSLHEKVTIGLNTTYVLQSGLELRGDGGGVWINPAPLI